jgi:hypothetical protein
MVLYKTATKSIEIKQYTDKQPIGNRRKKYMHHGFVCEIMLHRICLCREGAILCAFVVNVSIYNSIHIHYFGILYVMYFA